MRTRSRLGISAFLLVLLSALHPVQRIPDQRAYGSSGIISRTFLAQDTDGRFAMVEHRARPGSEPPPHVHPWEHEIFYVLEGKIEFHNNLPHEFTDGFLHTQDDANDYLLGQECFDYRPNPR
jgi:hypothetical protein